MVCPKCNGKTTIFDNCHVKDQNESYRKRRCIPCGNVFYTIEFEVSDDDRMADIWRENHRLYKFRDEYNKRQKEAKR